MATSCARVWTWLAGFCAGVAYGFGTPTAPVVWSALLAGIVLLAVRRRPALVAAALAAVAFALGSLDAQWRLQRGAQLAETARAVPNCAFAGRVLESEGGLGTLVALSRLECDRARHEGGPGLVWMEARPAPGARVAGEGWIVPLGDDGFGRARRRFGAGAELSTTSLHVTPPSGGLAGLAHALRMGLAEATVGMPPERAGLLTGLTTGDTSLLPASTTEEFRAAGLSHLVAVSGQNVAMILGALALATRKAAARVRILLAVATVGLFVLVVGPEPSVLRAGAMAVVVVAALGTGAKADPWNVLGVALVTVVALRPAIMFSAGLHLSAVATAGLLLWARPMYRSLARLPRWAAAGLAATLSAQAAVTPLIAGLFGSVSLAAPLANVLALPAVPPATVLGLGAAVAGSVHAGFGRFLAGLSEPFVMWILRVAHALGGSGWSAVAVPSWTAWPLAAIVVCAALATAFRSSRRDVMVAR